MAKLIVSNLASPGNLGLNTEDAGVDAPIDFAKIANNCVISKDNRLAARQGFEAVAPTVAFTGTVKSMYEVTNVDGTTDIVWGAGSKIYAGYPGKADITGALTITDSHWQFTILQNTLLAAQAGHAPIAWQKVAGVWTQQTITLPNGSASIPNIINENPNICATAFGRVFLADGTTQKAMIWFSEELNPLNFTTAGAGFLDLSTVLLGGDRLVAIASIGNRLLFLCSNQVVIYKANLYIDPADTVTPFLELEEVVKGVGCIARDSVVNTGTDVLWLAEQGLVSFGRLVQNDGQLPIGDISSNVHSAIQDEINATSDLRTVKAIWWATEKTYLILFRQSNRMYCFNTKNPAKPAVCTRWENIKTINSMVFDTNRNIYFGGENTFFIYRGYGSSTDSYRFQYYSGHLDFGDPSAFKFLKNISFLVLTSDTQPTSVKWAFDYSSAFESSAFPVSAVGGLTPEYNTSNTEYNIAEYSAGASITELRTQANLSGQYLQFGIETDVKGNPFVVYRTEVQVVGGKAY